jgi:hypothetical protein
MGFDCPNGTLDNVCLSIALNKRLDNTPGDRKINVD